jgi:formylglycine-generating enzyme required for sulfatase activity
MSEGNSIRASLGRVNRGGSWWYKYPEGARVALRSSHAPGNRHNNLGVRLVEEVEEELTPESGSGRVGRGGGWDYGPQYARVAIRDYIAPGIRSHDLGVRLVEEVTDV